MGLGYSLRTESERALALGQLRRPTSRDARRHGPDGAV
jgi:hypothetical protein